MEALGATDSRVPVVLCIDSEPDEHVYPPDDPAPWSGFEEATKRAPRIRAALEEATGVPSALCWSVRMDPQIALAYGSAGVAADRYADPLDGLVRAGDVIGVHPHAWRWDPSAQRWIADHADQDWLDECVDVAVTTYQAAFGRLPSYHRFGAGFMNTATMNAVRRAGVSVDITVEPGLPVKGPGERDGIVWTGTLGHVDVPAEPYQPDPADYRAPAGGAAPSDLWELPLSSGWAIPAPHPRLSTRTSYWARRPRRALRQAVRKLVPTPQPPRRPLHLLSDWKDPTHFWRSLIDAADAMRNPCLALGVRSDIFIRPQPVEAFDAVIAALGRVPERERLQFVGPDRALQMIVRAPQDSAVRTARRPPA